VKHGWRRIAWPAGFAAILTVAAWARISNFQAVLASGEMLPPDGDSAYHVLRILRTAERFPRVPTFDPDMNWPAGGMCPWADGFDAGGAAFVLALGGARSPQRSSLLAGLYVVVLGLLSVWATVALARAVAPERAREPVALASGLLAALLPQGVAVSRFARVDHHVLEALAMVLLARWVLTRPDAGEGGARRRVLFEVEGALLSAGAIYVFTGATVYVALAAAVALVSTLARRGAPPLLGSGAPGLLCGGGLAAALSLRAISEHGRWLSFAFPSLLQPALVAAAGGGLALATLVRRMLPGAGAAARTAATLATGIACVAALAIVWPGLASEVSRGIGGWLLHRDPWLSRVDEFQPLWSHPAYGGVWTALHDFFGVAGWLAPLSLVLGGSEAVRAGRARGLGFAALAAALLLLTLLQIRFGRVFAPFLAVATALALAWLARVAGAATGRWQAGGGAVLLAATALATMDPRLRTRLAISGPAAPDAIHSAALDLRAGARPPRGGGAGVATPWDLGHYVEAIAGRPVVANGFGSYLDEAGFEEMTRLGQASEVDLYALLERRDLGFLVAGAATRPGRESGPSAGAGDLFERREGGAIVLGRAYLREVPLAPLVIAGSGVPELGVRHLSRLLPRFASAQRVAGISFALPVLWGYERVPGARLSGTATPGTRVVAELPFREHGWPHTYRAWTDAGADGRWDLVVPVPTDFARPTLWTGRPWQVRVGGGAPVSVAVPESAVRAGSRIAVGVPPRRAIGP
jgi:dolichyl-diphosphooligosaccharide--protein glycosyltransferase